MNAWLLRRGFAASADLIDTDQSSKRKKVSRAMTIALAVGLNNFRASHHVLFTIV
jgi:hypothetical protein